MVDEAFQNQSKSIAALKALTVWHPHFEGAFREASRCLELGTPALIVGFCSGLTTLAKTLEVIRSDTLAIQVPFAFSTDRSWKELFARSVKILESSAGAIQPTAKTATLADLQEKFAWNLEQHQKQSVILDNASNLLSNSNSQRLTENLSYLKFLLDSTTNYLLQGDCSLLKEIFVFDQSSLSQRLSTIQLPPRYQGEDGHRDFKEILKTLQPFLTLCEEPFLEDVEFFYDKSIANISVLKNWFLRALLVALEENASLVQTKHFEKTALSQVKREWILRKFLRYEQNVEEILGGREISTPKKQVPYPGKCKLRRSKALNNKIEKE